MGATRTLRICCNQGVGDMVVVWKVGISGRAIVGPKLRDMCKDEVEREAEKEEEAGDIEKYTLDNENDVGQLEW